MPRAIGPADTYYPGVGQSADHQHSDSRQHIWTTLRAILLVLILVAYSPLFSADFTVWDDRYNIAENPHLNPPSLAGVAYYWEHAAFDLYIPVTYTAWAGLARMGYVASADTSGTHLNPYVFHAANVIAHALAGLLALEILRQLFKDPLAAGAGALLFALHPVQVEAVGWAAGLKDVLAGLFSLLAIWLYLLTNGSVAAPNRQRMLFWLATLSVTLAMLSKPIAMMTPAIAVWIDWVLRKRFNSRLLIWFIPAVVCAVIAKRSQPAMYSSILIDLWKRPFISGDALAFYLRKIVWPVHLGVDYGRSPESVLAGRAFLFWWIVPAICLVYVVWMRRRWPGLLAGAGVFFIGLLPVLGLVPFDFQIYSTVADHYLYLPMFGVGTLVAEVMKRIGASGLIAPRQARMSVLPVWIAIALAAVFLGVRTFVQAQTWKDSLTLFAHALDVNPQSWMSHDNLAAAYIAQGNAPSAKAHCLAAIAINPNIAVTHDKLALCLNLEGKPLDALKEYRKATNLERTDVLAWRGVADLLTAQGDSAGAIEAYMQAVAANPHDADLKVNLASTYAEHGRLDQAIQWYGIALRQKPASPEARAGLERATSEWDQVSKSHPSQGNRK